MRSLARIGSVLFVLISIAYADGPHQHRGFFLRMHLGPSYMHASADNDSTIRGPGASLGVAIGGAVAEDFIVFGELFGDSAVSPDIKYGGFSTSLSDASAHFVGLGPGAAYYVMPLNLYLAGTVAITRVGLKADGIPDDRDGTGPGIGMNMMLGKEWWVSANWGIGLAFHFAFGAAMTGEDLGGSDVKWNAVGTGVVFSSTYN